MKKTTVHAHLLQQQIQLVKDLELNIKTLKEDSDIDEDALKDAEDFSHQSEAKEMERRIKEQLNVAKIDLSTLEHCSDNPCDKVQIGALVLTDKNNFYICISTTHLELENKNIVGISDKAPIYQKMKAKKAGDSFEMANIQYKILEVL